MQNSAVASKQTIALFASYFENEDIPVYIQFYLIELTKCFDKVYFLCNEKKLSQKTIDFCNEHSIILQLHKNEGYDFGLWYKALKTINLQNVKEIALINDSCVLFKPLKPYLERMRKLPFDYCGMLDSVEIRYHVQSYFLLLRNEAISVASNYILQQGIVNETDIRKFISIFELGISDAMQNKKTSIGSLYSYRNFYFPLNFRFSSLFVEKIWHKLLKIYALAYYKSDFKFLQKNPAYFLLHRLMKNNFPLIKKSILQNIHKEEYKKNLESFDSNEKSRFFSEYILNSTFYKKNMVEEMLKQLTK